MSTYSPESQMNFVIQWFKGWSEFQKEDFVHVLSQRIKEGGGNIGDNANPDAVNYLVNGIKGLDMGAGGRPPSLFICQVKLFNEWWTTWSPADRDKMFALFKEADVNFITSVESDMNGESLKLNEDFMMVPKSEEDDEGGLSKANGDSAAKTKLETPVFNVTKVVINNGPSSFSSIDHEDANNGVDVESEARNDDHDSKNVDCDSAEPVATEI